MSQFKYIFQSVLIARLGLEREKMATEEMTIAASAIAT